MKRYFVVCALAVMFGSTAKAQDACNPFYIGASTGVSLLQDHKDDGGRAMDYDAGHAFSAFLGWNEGPGRIEFEFSRFNNDVDSFNNVNAATGSVDLFAYMINGYLDFPISSRLTGYLGGGLGVAQTQVNSLHAPVGLLGGPRGDDATSDFGLAYQTKVGASYSLTNRAELFGGYRFLGTEKTTVRGSTLGLNRYADQNYMHSLETGLRFSF